MRNRQKGFALLAALIAIGVASFVTFQLYRSIHPQVQSQPILSVGNGSGTINRLNGGGGGTTTPGGSDKQVQFNDSGAFGGSAYFTFDKDFGVVYAQTISAFDGNTITLKNYSNSGSLVLQDDGSSYLSGTNEVRVQNDTNSNHMLLGQDGNTELTSANGQSLYLNNDSEAQFTLSGGNAITLRTSGGEGIHINNEENGNYLHLDGGGLTELKAGGGEDLMLSNENDNKLYLYGNGGVLLRANTGDADLRIEHGENNNYLQLYHAGAVELYSSNGQAVTISNGNSTDFILGGDGSATINTSSSQPFIVNSDNNVEFNFQNDLNISNYNNGSIIHYDYANGELHIAANTYFDGQIFTPFTSGGTQALFVNFDGGLTVTGSVPVSQGGTGFSSYAVGDILYANTTSSLARLADVATGNVLISGGVSTVPSWGKVGLTTAVSGTLPVANGGTGTSNGSITGTGALTFAAGGSNQAVTLTPSGSGITTINGAITATNLAGTGTRMVVASSTGVLSSQAIPTGTVTSVSGSGGTTGLTLTGGAITTSGTLTLGGTLNVANGGTGLTSLTANYIPYGNGTGAFASSVNLQYSAANGFLVNNNAQISGSTQIGEYTFLTDGNFYTTGGQNISLNPDGAFSVDTNGGSINLQGDGGISLSTDSNNVQINGGDGGHLYLNTDGSTELNANNGQDLRLYNDTNSNEFKLLSDGGVEFDTANSSDFTFNGDNVDISSFNINIPIKHHGIGLSQTNINSSITATRNMDMIVVDGGTSGIVIDLPGDAPEVYDGMQIIVKMNSLGGSNTIDVTSTNAGGGIDNQTTFQLTKDWQSNTFVYNEFYDTWHIIQ